MTGGRAGGRGGRGGHTAYVDEVYERDDAARDARAEERFQRLKRRVASVIQRLEALEVGGLPRHQPFKPSLPTEVDFSDGVSITKLLPGNHQSTGRTRVVKVANRDSRLWESGLKINFLEFQKGMTPEKILKVGAREKKVIEEILVEGDVGDSIDDVQEEELGEIFLSTDTCFSESQYDCDLPPKYDEYPDDKYEICELSTVEGVHVVIEETRTTLPKENASEGIPLPINLVNVMDIPAYIQQGPSFAFANGSCVFPDTDIPPIIRCDKPNVIKGFSFQDGKVTEDGNWVFCGGAWDDSSLVVAFYRNVDKGTQLIGRINLRFKADVDNQRRAKLLKQNSRTSFFQPGENDAEWKWFII